MRLAYSATAQRRRHAREARDRYRSLFELATAACVVTDLAGTVVDVNRAATSLLGHAAPAMLGRPFVDFVSSRQRRAFAAMLSEARFLRRPMPERRMRLWVAGRPLDTAVSAAFVQLPGEDPLLGWSLRDVSDLKIVEARLHRSQARGASRGRIWREEARALAARCLEAREEEARRIAHALHDEASQITASAGLVLQGLEADVQPSARPRIRQALALVLEVEERLRCISHELRPTVLDDLGLAAALGFLAESFSTRTGISVDVRGDMGEGRLDPVAETALYRVTQEALANVARHARAQSVIIELRRRKATLLYTLRDDGVGFDPTEAGRAGGLGLVGMRERLQALDGSLVVHSTHGRGTQIVASLPAGRFRSLAAS